MDQDLLQLALRVLNYCTFREAPLREEVEALRAAAPEPDRNLPADLIAMRIIEREIARGRSLRHAAAAE